MPEPIFLLYGANGYTGALIARLAVQRGLRPILAGRNAQAIAALGQELNLDYRIFRLDDREATRAALRLASLVLHCAGPFIYSSAYMVDACLRAGAHYLDITGEIPVFEQLWEMDADARASGIMLLPGAGFDVVPSDCLAMYLKDRLPSANKLAIAVDGLAGMSHGTALSALESISSGVLGMERRNGRLHETPLAAKERRIDFGEGERLCISVPLGDVATAFRSTGIPNIEVYLALPASAAWALQWRNLVDWLLRRRRVQRFLRQRIQTAPHGPSEARRTTGRTLLWGRVEDSAGASAESLLQTPEIYQFTALTAIAIVEKVLAGQAPAGFQTPAAAYGADFVLSIAGVGRWDLT
jgi:short subunit dehydrogenase-like uncharacterized protein